MNKEYIERESFIKILKETKDDCKHYPNKVVCDFAIRMVNLMPTADVQEVRHGKNVTPFHPADEFICSECGIVFKDMNEYIIEDDVYREFYFKICPNCGAKMDKE